MVTIHVYAVTSISFIPEYRAHVTLSYYPARGNGLDSPHQPTPETVAEWEAALGTMPGDPRCRYVNMPSVLLASVNLPATLCWDGQTVRQIKDPEYWYAPEALLALPGICVDWYTPVKVKPRPEGVVYDIDNQYVD